MRLERAVRALRAAGVCVSVAVPGNGSGGPGIGGVTSDSRQVRRGCLFVALRGTRMDGLKFAPEAVRRGAAAVVADRPMRGAELRRVVRIRVRDAGMAYGILASEFYGRPTERLRIHGVTGTNGKTTTTYLIRRLLMGAGIKTALLGTVNEEIPGRPPVPSALTTPDAVNMNRFFRQALDAGCEAGVCEVSSHALDQRRVWGIRFHTVVFTNLTQDHLDYHRTMEKYFEAKKKLFVEYEYEKAVVNIDDAYGRRLAALLERAGRPVVTFGRRRGATVRILSARSDLRGTRARLNAFGKDIPLRLSLIGDYNLSNAAAALSACGDPANVSTLARLLAGASAPPGRMERVDAGQAFVALVDYAHTPDALEKLLLACRRLNPRRLICLFGCGGDRDRTKRPKMARVVTRLADFAIVTSDNPRAENPMDIIRDIRPGFRGREGQTYVVEPDRRRAIALACRMARRGEIVAMAGKGHETYQIIGTTKFPFDDRKVARTAILETLRAAGC